jgi:hypothetical protein
MFKKILATLVMGTTLLSAAVPAFAASSPYQFRATQIQVHTPSGVKTIDCENFAYQGTTYVPIFYMIEALHAAGASANWNGKTQTFTISDPFASSVSALPVKSGTVNLVLNGKASGFHASRIVATDPQSHVETTYMKLGDLQSVIGAYGITNPWNGSVTPNMWVLPKFYDPVPQTQTEIGSSADAVYYLISGYGGTFDGMTDMSTPFFIDKYYVIAVVNGSVYQSVGFSSQPTTLTGIVSSVPGGSLSVYYDSHTIAIVSTGGSGAWVGKITPPLPTETISSVQYVPAGTLPNLQTNDSALQVTTNDGNVYYYDASNAQLVQSTN